MKLALIRRKFDEGGGAELYAQRLISALTDSGHEVHLFAESWTSTPGGVRLHRIESGGTRSTRARKFANAVRAELISLRFDCVFSLERTIRQDVYRAGDGVHRIWLERRRQASPWWKRWLIGRGLFHRGLLVLERETFDPSTTGRVIVNSEMVRREIRQCFDFPDDRIHLVRNGVCVERFQNLDRRAARARFGISDSAFVLVFAGSGWERKGLAYAIETARRLQSSNVKLLVAGKGTPPSNTPENVLFAGPMRDVEMAYGAGDLLLCLPLYEPSANVVCEALAAGLPVVTCVQNGASEWIKEGETGSVVKNPADISAVTAAIEPWISGSRKKVSLDLDELRIERNMRETLEILSLGRD